MIENTDKDDTKVRKGALTRATILKRALELVRMGGLGAISLAGLAQAVGMSKSGLFAHFRSKQSLQEAILACAEEAFVDWVVRPAIQEPRGLPRIEALFERWLTWAAGEHFRGGCLFLSAATELDDKPGPLRDRLVMLQQAWLQTLERAVTQACVQGHLCPEVAAVSGQWAYELYANMMGFHFFVRLMGDDRAQTKARTAFYALLKRGGATQDRAISP